MVAPSEARGHPQSTDLAVKHADACVVAEFLEQAQLTLRKRANKKPAQAGEPINFRAASIGL